jgi:hypothetical protein
MGPEGSGRRALAGLGDCELGRGVAAEGPGKSCKIFCRLAGLGFLKSPWDGVGPLLGGMLLSAGLSGNTMEGEVWA